MSTPEAYFVDGGLRSCSVGVHMSLVYRKHKGLQILWAGFDSRAACHIIKHTGVGKWVSTSLGH